MAITKEHIWHAAEALVAAGESPTLAAIRKKIGGGSFTTISEALQEWRQQMQQQADIEAVILPEAIQALVLNTGKTLWQAARNTARAEVEHVKADLSIQMQVTQQERAEVQALAEQVETELEQARAQIKSLEERCRNAEMKAHETEVLAIEREQRIQKLEQELHAARTSADQRNDAAIQALAAQVATIQNLLGKSGDVPPPEPRSRKK